METVIALLSSLFMWSFLLVVYAISGSFAGTLYARTRKYQGRDDLRWTLLGLAIAIFALFPLTFYLVEVR